MTAQRHRIRRQVLEVKAPDEDSARRIQTELSRIQRQYLDTIVEQCCSELSAPDRIHRIDLLELDLGTIDSGQLERELPAKLKSVMRKVLAKQIEKQDSEARRRDHDPAVTSQLELIAFFAATGTLPWWADSSNSRLIPETLDALLEHAPDRLADLLRTIAPQRAQLTRIVLHSDDKILSRLLRILLSASSVTALQQRTEAILRIWSHVRGTNITLARNVFWLALIRQAGTASTSPAAFWQQVFIELEGHSHEAYVSLATSILRAAQSGASSHLAQLIGVAFADRQSRVFTGLPADVQAELTQILDEQATPRFGIASEVVSATGSTARPPIATDSRERHRTDAPPRSHLRFHRDDYLDLAFGDSDTVYIENSGLVVLWPFLTRFFERLELVDGGRFKKVPAQHRAAGLLQYMVTEDPSPPEYQTTLNKILCGLDPGEVLDFGAPVTDTESEESAILLTSAIAQAPILRDMSIEGFWGSFLLRHGLLTARDGAWLLRVKRETYDVVLDRFPWSVAWIKFPWMPVPLGVEW